MSEYNWVKNEHHGAVILAGGDSKRLGQAKALLDFQGRTLIELMVTCLVEYFDQITVVTDKPDLYHHLPVKLTSDIIVNEKKSPLRGIHAGLSVSELPHQFFTACDMPFLNLELIDYMSGFALKYDAVVPCIGEYFQPLHAFYSRTCIDVIENQFMKGHFKVADFYEHIRVKYIGLDEILRFDPAQESFININRWSDYEYALKVFAEKQRTCLNGGEEI